MDKLLVEQVAKAIHDNYFAHSWESETDGAGKECIRQAARAAIEAVRSYKHSDEAFVEQHFRECNSLLEKAHKDIHEKYPKMFDEPTQNPSDACP